jgi:hypothetical protein
MIQVVALGWKNDARMYAGIRKEAEVEQQSHFIRRPGVINTSYFADHLQRSIHEKEIEYQKSF